MNDPDPHTTPPPAGPEPTPWTAPPGQVPGPAPTEPVATPPPTPLPAPGPPPGPQPGTWGPPAAPPVAPEPGTWGPTPTQPPTAPPPATTPQWGAPTTPGAPAADAAVGGAPYGGAAYGGATYGGQAPAQPYAAAGWGGPTIASPGVRIGAKVIDVVIIVIVQIVVGIVVGLVVGAATISSGGLTTFSGETDPFGGINLTAAIVGGLVGLAIDFVYNVVFVARFGGQPGKLMLGLRVVTVDGAAPSMGVAFRRWTPILFLLVIGLVPIVSIFAGLLRLVLAVANLVMIFADDRRRDVFDHVAGTLVVTTR